MPVGAMTEQNPLDMMRLTDVDPAKYPALLIIYGTPRFVLKFSNTYEGVCFGVFLMTLNFSSGWLLKSIFARKYLVVSPSGCRYVFSVTVMPSG